MNLALEVDERTELAACPRCGSESARTRGYVFEDDRLLSVYNAHLSDHSETGRVVGLAFGFGDWTDDGGPDDRFSVGLDLWAVEGEYRMAIVEPDEALSRQDSLLGGMGSRDRVLASGAKDLVFALATFVADQDARVGTFLRDGADLPR